MADVLDVIYRLGSMAGKAADELRVQISDAQKILDELDAFANNADDVSNLAAASDLFPTYSALIPERSGLTRRSAETGTTE
jgi:hypothetical protein